MLGVPSYRLRFRGRAALAATERFFLLIRQEVALLEEWDEPFVCAIECDGTMFGSSTAGKRGWGAAGKVILFGI